ncbi:MAG: hypothetical protein ACRDHM_06770, partial [Actinomycetota bacterium]
MPTMPSSRLARSGTAAPGGLRLGDVAPVLLIVAGFALIGLAWNGAASLDYTQGQLPYLISGGLGGLAAVLYGSAAMVVRQMKRAHAAQRVALEELAESMRNLQAALSARSHAPDPASWPEMRPEAPAVPRWGVEAPQVLGEPPGSDGAAEDVVLAGTTSYHLPSCRVAAGRASMARISSGEA